MDKFLIPVMYGGPPPMRAYTFYDYLIVVDFEATCDSPPKNGPGHGKRLTNERPEIIQFPAVLIDVREMRIVDHFDRFVKPSENSILSEFCTSLTGITQDMVDKAAPFPKVLREFERWMKKHGLSNTGTGKTFAIVTDGSYDIGHFLYKQCLISNIPFPKYAKRWVNIRTNFATFYGQRWFSLKSVLELLGVPFEGQAHNGLDDAKNISKVLLGLLRDGGIITQTEEIVLDPVAQESNALRILRNRNAGKYDLATVTSVSAGECIYMIPRAPGYIFFKQPPHPLPEIGSDESGNKENIDKTRRACHKKRKTKGKRNPRIRSGIPASEIDASKQCDNGDN